MTRQQILDRMEELRIEREADLLSRALRIADPNADGVLIDDSDPLLLEYYRHVALLRDAPEEAGPNPVDPVIRSNSPLS